MIAVNKYPTVVATAAAFAAAVAATFFNKDIDAGDIAPILGGILAVGAWLYRLVQPSPQAERGFRSVPAPNQVSLDAIYPEPPSSSS